MAREEEWAEGLTMRSPLTGVVVEAATGSASGSWLRDGSSHGQRRVGGRWAERPAVTSTPTGVVVEAAALGLGFQSPCLRGLHCPANLEMEGVGATEA
jgi:hypothetical protein